MDTIISYIDNLFRNYPDTPQVRKAKKELLAIMEDKYHELKSEGKSEHEAIGIVISEFGSMEEIAFELGFDKETVEQQTSPKGKKREKRLSASQAESYLKDQDNFGHKIGIGVALCILSPTTAAVMSSLESVGFLPGNIADLIGATVLFLMVAMAVAIFILSGFSISKYEGYQKVRIVLDHATREKIKKERESFRGVFSLKITVGVVLCILSVVPVFIIAELLEGTFLAWISEASSAGLFIFVAAGVYLFITAGVLQGAYETLLGKDGVEFDDGCEKEGDKLVGVIAAVYWPLVTAGYLVWSFATLNWGFTWIVWPVAGVIFGGISGAIKLVRDGK